MDHTTPPARPTRRSFLQGFGLAAAVPAAGVLAARADEPATRPADAVTGRATGTVYGVTNGEKAGLAGVRVCNGRTFATTDGDGRYAIDVTDDTTLFVVKPRGHRPPTDGRNLPQFFYNHVPAGTPDDDFVFPGVEATGPLPTSIDFELEAYDEPDAYTCVLFGDPQPYTVEEVLFYSRDVTDEFRRLGGCAFGVGMGDLVGDNLALHALYNDANAASGFPWYNVVGNHDIEFMAPTDVHADAAFRRTFGPATYMFQYGRAHFVVLNNVYWNGFRGLRRDGWPQRGNYEGRIRPEQLDLIREYVKGVPTDEAIVVLMHIPLYAFEGEGSVHTTPQARELLEILSNHPHTFSASGHTHINHVHVAGPERGYTTSDGRVHLHHNVGAICGSWFRGEPDQRGIPYATQRDGTPRGYAVVEFDGPEFKVGYRRLGGADDEQMLIYLPADVVTRGTPLRVDVNVYDGSRLSRTRCRVDASDWREMQNVTQVDPNYVRLQADSKAWAAQAPGRREVNEPVASDHHWTHALDTASLEEGLHVVEVESTDHYGRTHTGRRMFRLHADAADLPAFDATGIRTPRPGSRADLETEAAG